MALNNMRAPLDLVDLNVAANNLRPIQANAPVTWQDLQKSKEVCVVATISQALVQGDTLVRVVARDHILSNVAARAVYPDYFPDNTAILAQLRKMSQELNQRLDAMDTKIDNVKTELSNKIDNVKTELSNKVDTVKTELSNKIDTVDRKVDRVKTELSRKLDKVTDDLTKKIDDSALLDIGKEGEPNVVDAKAHIVDRLKALDGQFAVLDARVQNIPIYEDNRMLQSFSRPLKPLLKVKSGNGNINDIGQRGRPTPNVTGKIGEQHPGNADGRIDLSGTVNASDISSLVYFYNDTMGIVPTDNIVQKAAKVNAWLTNGHLGIP